MVFQTSLVCGIRDGLATVVVFSSFTCFQEILTEVNENGENIENIIDILEPESTNVGNLRWENIKYQINFHNFCFVY